MEGKDLEMVQVHPVGVEVMEPICLATLDGSAGVKLSAKSVKLDGQVARDVFYGGQVDVKRMCLFVNRHCGVNDRVQARGMASDRHRNELTGRKCDFVEGGSVCGWDGHVDKIGNDY